MIEKPESILSLQGEEFWKSAEITEERAKQLEVTPDMISADNKNENSS